MNIVKFRLSNFAHNALFGCNFGIVQGVAMTVFSDLCVKLLWKTSKCALSFAGYKAAKVFLIAAKNGIKGGISLVKFTTNNAVMPLIKKTLGIKIQQQQKNKVLKLFY